MMRPEKGDIVFVDPVHPGYPAYCAIVRDDLRRSPPSLCAITGFDAYMRGDPAYFHVSVYDLREAVWTFTGYVMKP